MMQADIHRLDSADRTVTAEIQIAQDGARFVAFSGQTATTAQSLPRPLRLTGLNPDARYSVTLLNPQDRPRHSRGPLALATGPLHLSGRALMSRGLQLPVAWPATMWVIEGTTL